MSHSRGSRDEDRSRRRRVDVHARAGRRHRTDAGRAPGRRAGADRSRRGPACARRRSRPPDARSDIDHPGVLTTTSDLDAGVAGADAVLLQLRVGGQAARGQDETWPLECGCVGQETTGAGGLAKALRTVPVVLDIASRVQKASPDAWIVDFTNPVGIVTRALLEARAQGGGTVQRGHRLPAQVRRHAGRRAGAGAARPRGAQPPDLGTAGARRRPGPATGAARRAPRGDRRGARAARRGCCSSSASVPSYYLRYFYAHDEVVRELQASPSRAAQVAEIEQELLRLYADPTTGHEARAADPARRRVLLRGRRRPVRQPARQLDQAEEQVVNVRNGDTLPFLPPDAVVEVPARVAGGAVTPLPGGAARTAVRRARVRGHRLRAPGPRGCAARRHGTVSSRRCSRTRSWDRSSSPRD